MDDFISRKAAIDAIDRERKKKHLFNTAEDGFLEARRLINTLPSAQQIVRCKDCKNHDWCSIAEMALDDETFFCQWGERRE